MKVNSTYIEPKEPSLLAHALRFKAAQLLARAVQAARRADCDPHEIDHWLNEAKVYLDLASKQS